MTRLVDTATLEDTSWDFLLDNSEHETWRRQMVEDLWGEAERGVQLPVAWEPDPELMAKIRKRTDRVARRYEVSAEDLFADTVLHMAVRPSRLASTGREVGLVLHVAEQVATDLARPMSSRAAREESLEATLSGGDDQWPL